MSVRYKDLVRDADVMRHVCDSSACPTVMPWLRRIRRTYVFPEKNAVARSVDESTWSKVMDIIGDELDVTKGYIKRDSFEVTLMVL